MLSRSTPQTGPGRSVGAGPLSGVTQSSPGQSGNDAASSMSSQVARPATSGPSAPTDIATKDASPERKPSSSTKRPMRPSAVESGQHEAEDAELGHHRDGVVAGDAALVHLEDRGAAVGIEGGLERDRLGGGEELRGLRPRNCA